MDYTLAPITSWSHMFDQCIDIATIILERPRWAFRPSSGSGFLGIKGREEKCYTATHKFMLLLCKVLLSEKSEKQTNHEYSTARAIVHYVCTVDINFYNHLHR